MAKEQFEEGINNFYKNKAITKVYARIGPGEEDSFVIMGKLGICYQASNWSICYQASKWGILINEGKTFHYLPYETIIALTGMCAAQDYKF